MARIKRFHVFDIFQIRKIISSSGATDLASYTNIFWMTPFSVFQSFLPLLFRKLPESYVSIENNKINGMVTVKSERGNSCKWNIVKLFLDKNANEAGKQLVEYIVSRYGAMGVNTFCAFVDQTHEEILTLFSKGCGFRLCSHENLWKMDEPIERSDTKTYDVYRTFKNSDAEAVCEIYNDSIYPHFRYSLAKSKPEFYDRLFQGFSSVSSFKYVVCDPVTEKIKAYLDIQTTDNTNYVLDIVLNQPYEDLYDDIICFAQEQISKRKKHFYLFVLARNYQTSSKKFEEKLKKKKFSLIQTQMVLVRDFFKTVEQEERVAKPALFFSEIKGKPAFSIETNSEV